MTFGELQVSIISKVRDQMENGSVADGFIAEITQNYFLDLLRNYPGFKPDLTMYFNVSLTSDISTAYAYRNGVKLMSSVVKI